MLQSDYAPVRLRPTLQCFGAQVYILSTLEHRALVLFRFGPSLPTSGGGINRSNVKKQTQDFNSYVAPKTSVDL